jgi:nucleotide-binding universal stress UspA family protein
MTNAMIRPVVVGIDGSEPSVRAVRWAAAYAARRGLPLRLVHVDGTQILFPSGIVAADVLYNATRARAREWLRDARETAVSVAPDLRPVTELTHEPLIPTLIEESRTASALVLGTRGLGGFTGLLLGSTAVSLAGRACCPLLVVREDGDGDGPVVVGVDGTPAGEEAIAFAFAEASARGGRLVAVHAWADPVVDTVLLGHTDPPDFDPAQQRAYELLAERLVGWQEKYPDVRVTREIVRDHSSRALLRYAEGAALVVVGSRGRGGFRGLVLGSTGQQLLHHAPCPVAIVRSEVEEPKEE